jgi:hypothetical protein
MLMAATETDSLEPDTSGLPRSSFASNPCKTGGGIAPIDSILQDSEPERPGHVVAAPDAKPNSGPKRRGCALLVCPADRRSTGRCAVVRLLQSFQGGDLAVAPALALERGAAVLLLQLLLVLGHFLPQLIGIYVRLLHSGEHLRLLFIRVSSHLLTQRGYFILVARFAGG